MIKKFEFYHGAVLTKLIHEAEQSIIIEPYPSPSNASYILNKSTGIFIKHSVKRMPPWRFSFAKEHQDEILEMKNRLGEVFLLLVCGEDGIVTLSFMELKKILNETHEPVEWISATRNRNTEYAIKGSDGYLNYKISKNDFPKKIFQIQNLVESIDSEAQKTKIFSWL